MNRIDLDGALDPKDFSVRIRNGFARAGVRTVRDLCSMSKERLLSIGNFGAKSVFDCERWLAGYGLRLGMTGGELDQYAKSATPRIYISGPMTGLGYDVYFPKFWEAKGVVERTLPGWEAFNPCQNGLPLDAPVGEHMRRDLVELTRCRAIYMMDGWQRSAECRTELMAAMAMGLDVYFQSSMGLPKGEDGE